LALSAVRNGHARSSAGLVEVTGEPGWLTDAARHHFGAVREELVIMPRRFLFSGWRILLTSTTTQPVGMSGKRASLTFRCAVSSNW
jgi:hypothetical protein